MTRKNVILILVAVLLATAYAYFFTDWIIKPRIQITAQFRPFLPMGSAKTAFPISFNMDRHYGLTDLKVVKVEAGSTEAKSLESSIVWHLTTRSNSAPTRGFLYGNPIKGMALANPAKPAEFLEPGKTYRLMVEAGKAKGMVEFKTMMPN